MGRKKSQEVNKMAQKRMISKSIVNSSPFLNLGRDAQILYIAATVSADDEGIVDIDPLINLLKMPAEQPLSELLNCGLLVMLPKTGRKLVWIRDWETANHVQPSRFVESVYHDLKIEALKSLKEEFYGTAQNDY